MEQRQVTVQGSSTEKIPADLAEIRVSTKGYDASLLTAGRQADVTMEHVINSLKQIGVEDRDIETSSYTAYQTGLREGASPQQFRVDNTVKITVRDVSRIGELIATVGSLGAAQIADLRFKASDTVAAETRVRRKAVADAERWARSYAEAAKAGLGQVMQIRQIGIGGGGNQPWAWGGAGIGPQGLAQGLQQPPIRAREIDLVANVEVTWELIDAQEAAPKYEGQEIAAMGNAARRKGRPRDPGSRN